MPNCVRKYRLRRRAASSMATVVRCRSPEPNSRMSRSRRSSCCNRMNTATMRMIAAVASGFKTGDMMRSATSNGEGLGCRTSTGRGALLWSSPGAARFSCSASFLPAFCTSPPYGPDHFRQRFGRETPKGFNLLPDCRLVARHIVGQLRHLHPDNAGQCQKYRDGNQHR